jgi:hypothetical protein
MIKGLQQRLAGFQAIIKFHCKNSLEIDVVCICIARTFGKRITKGRNQPWGEINHFANPYPSSDP